MFTTKKTQLFTPPAKKKPTVKVKSSFVAAGMKKAAETTSGNGSLKYSTTGSAFIDQFGVMGSYKKPRPFREIEQDMEKAWAIDPLTAIRFTLYIRMITRVTDIMGQGTTLKSQKGGELKHEGIMRMIWLHAKAPQSFWKNITLFIAVGSWKDIITMLQYDLVYNGWEGKVLDWKQFGELILSGLENKSTSELLKKYLPQIKANSQCTTVEAQADNMIAKWICSLLFGSKSEDKSGYYYKKYRKLKSSGSAHQWQQLISQQKFDRIDFSTIHGRALSLLVKSKFLRNHGLTEKYTQWVTKPETEVKYTGFVHELFEPVDFVKRVLGTKYTSLSQVPVHEQETINKQFATLVNKGQGEDNTSPLIVVRDTSGSMSSIASGTNMSCFSIGKALALYFSEFLEGPFADAWIEFNSDAQMHQWQGNTPLEKWFNDRSTFFGSTNFQSVIQLFVRLKRQGIQESDFPKGILCISDGEFNPTQLNVTNVAQALATLKSGGFSDDYIANFVIVLWNLQSNHYGSTTGKKFETHGVTIPNVFYFSGYSASTVSFLTSKIKNAQELFEEALNQQVLQLAQL